MRSTAVITDTKYSAYSKARTMREMLRTAARHAVDPVAQAVLAILIAEAWRDESGKWWRTKISQETLATRIGRTPRTVRRAIDELRDRELIRVKPGKIKTVSTYWLNDIGAESTTDRVDTGVHS